MTGTVQQAAAAPPRGHHRLLAAWAHSGRAANLAAHHDRHGMLPSLAGERIVDAVTASGLQGRGGAGFPTGRKLTSVAGGRRRPVIVANGCEGEPVSEKDHVLLTLAPHLVLDGLQLAARAVGADEITLCVHRDDRIGDAVATALGHRHDEFPVRVLPVPRRYASSEESALVNFINTGDARPTAKPPRPFERGVRGRPTLVDNVETLAHIALIARYGPDWFRTCGTADSPGTALFTVAGATARAGVYEAPLGVPMRAVLDNAGGPCEPVQAVLTGGYAGTWLPLPFAAGQRLTHAGLRDAGASLGVGALVLLPARACGLTETAHILRYLAGESAAQCGPCMFGLPAIAEDFTQLVLGGRPARAAVDRLRRRLEVIPGRGACAHPDGAVRLASSALRVFDRDLRAHVAGHPCRGAGYPLLPVARADATTGWR
ncbi:MAG TPA: NADH-ubiquinone oxidoreductase-F iron-sulfur binding region domain-containing protein [Pseudonocardiaceae bacterium]|nr:NADH-ubiquinone oxidoreductase-F iron-sulfur binding region domain-containing protein [Pseudonocardiaceae bacterium]